MDNVSYSAGIIVNVTSFSSIPEKFSSTIQSVHADKDKVFRGYPPSEFNIHMVSSIYKNTVTSEESTGYFTMQTQTPVAGKSTLTSNVPFTTNLLVKIILSLKENTLVIEREQAHSWILLVIIMFGGAVGLLGLCRILMSMYEMKYRQLFSLLVRKRYDKEVKQTRDILKNYLCVNEDRELSESPLTGGMQSPNMFFPIETEFKDNIDKLR